MGIKRARWSSPVIPALSWDQRRRRDPATGKRLIRSRVKPGTTTRFDLVKNELGSAV